MALYDFIIAGAGAAGLGLAYRMAMSPLRGQSILLIDREAKDKNDRTWSFWTTQPTHLDHLVYRTWHRVEVVSEDFHRAFDLTPYRYHMIRGLDYYNGIREALGTVPEVSFYQGRVNEIKDNKDKTQAQVQVDTLYHGARYAFDSTFRLSEMIKGPPGYHYLKQHFKGWEIETPTDCFDPSTVTMFDFRTPQQGCMRFFYLLPFSRRRALVEYTLFSYDLLKPHEYDRALSEYIDNVLCIPKYRIEAVENGVIPMTDRPFHRRLGERILAIGTRGGLVKPSSGYGFLRMQHDASAVVDSLVTYGDPFHLPRSPGRYHLFDTIMLQVMYRRGNQMKDIFIQMFRNNTIQQIFRFLDEEASFAENLPFLTSLPIGTFVKAMLKAKILRKI